MIKCIFETGNSASLRHVTVDAIIIKENKVLLIKRSTKYHIEPGKFALPGGYLDRDESADEGIVREVLEETGHHSQVVSLFQVIHQPRSKGDDRQNVEFAFTVKLLTKVSEPDDEVESLHWLNVKKLPKKLIAFDHFDIITLYRKHLHTPYSLPIINWPK